MIKTNIYITPFKLQHIGSFTINNKVQSLLMTRKHLKQMWYLTYIINHKENLFIFA